MIEDEVFNGSLPEIEFRGDDAYATLKQFDHFTQETGGVDMNESAAERIVELLQRWLKERS
jgi:hypothetical protein